MGIEKSAHAAMVLEQTTIFSILMMISYLLAAIWAARRRITGTRTTEWLTVYLMFAFLWELAHLAIPPMVIEAIDASSQPWAPVWGVVALGVLFMNLTAEFTSQKRGIFVLSVLSTIGMIILFAVLFYPIILHGVSSIPPDFGVELRAQILAGGLIGVAGLTTGWATLITLLAYTKASQPMHKNRLFYWLLSLACLATGNVLLSNGYIFSGEVIHFIGAMAAAYVILTHQLADLGQMGLKTLDFAFNSLIAIIAYALIFELTQTIFQDLSWYTPALAGITLAVMLVILVNPILQIIQRGLKRLLHGSGYSPTNIVREYSLGISNIVDLGMLSDTSIELIKKLLGIRHGQLFLVDELTEEGNVYFAFRPARVSLENPPSGKLLANSPAALQLNQGLRPLTQYDLDFLPMFQTLSEAEREWLKSLDADVYVPIYTKGLWIGLFALGAKTSGDRYFKDDFSLLSTLADQTVIALQNGRLFADLASLNAKLQKAYKELETANVDLRQMDAVKTNFISVVSHELRTPFANLGFNQQIFEMYGLDKLTSDQREQWRQITGGIKSAGMLVEDLVTLAMLVTGRGKVRNELVHLREMLRETMAPLKTMADTKKINFGAEILGDLPPIYGDRKLIGTAMYHLVHNAIKFTKEGGKVQISCWATPEALFFNVKDTGVGIPEEKLETIWSNFAQNADPVKRGLEGLGLGLALVKYIASAHRGTVWVESLVNVGSEFGFQIPAPAVTRPRPNLPLPRSNSE